jgi:hypothetical protein
MKGWELYSWQEGGAWRFSLLVGTNRLKSASEIRSPATRLDGIDALGRALRELAPGQEVMWGPPWSVADGLALPPAGTLEQVRRACDEHRLLLTIPQSG